MKYFENLGLVYALLGAALAVILAVWVLRME